MESSRSYLIGFALALLLTALPFALAAAGTVPRTTSLIVIAVAAVVQIFVHLHYFLHLDPTTTPRENLVAIAFTALLVLIMLGGSLWIMFDLQHRMLM
jgi:cytochrome o ubiquinol oxidase operon protein cyoD